MRQAPPGPAPVLPPGPPLMRQAPPGPPPPPLSAPTPPRPARSDAPDPWAVRIAILIGVLSILSAVVAWRGSVASSDASDLKGRGMQATADRLQALQRIEGVIDQDERLVARYSEHLLAANDLDASADDVRPSDAPLADELDLEAQGERALARALEPFFWVGRPTIGEDGAPVYDEEFVSRNLRDADLTLRELQPERLFQAGDAAGRRAQGFVILTLVLVASLFFLTLAQLLRRPIRFWFLGTGAIGGLIGLLGLAVLEALR
jgi:hypothetical protein